MINTSPETMGSPIGWVCVKTQPKREAVAAAQLSQLCGVEVFAPRIRFRRKTQRGRVWFEESLFPGYIFSRFTPGMQRAVSSAVGVRGLVRFAGECAIVPDVLIASLQDEARGTIVVEEPALQEGAEAVVAEGSMRGLRVLVTQVLSGGERVKVLLDLMGTSVEAEIQAEALDVA